MRILKFGGKSLSSLNKIQNICKYIKEAYKSDKNIVVVVSAMGQTTDELISLANEYGNNSSSKRELATLLSTGETQSASLFAMHLISIGVPAKSLLSFQLQTETFGDYLNSRVAYISKNPILECFKEGSVAVVAGFQGVNKKNEITTLGRGGSDTTATALGAVFGIDVEIFSDFDGVFTGDPRAFAYKKLKSVDYDTMINIALGGAKVLDSRATEIAKRHGIKIFAKCSYALNNKGTIISSIESDVIMISNIDHLCKITIAFSDKSKMNKIALNVINSLKNEKLYNLSIENEKISFFVDQAEKNIIIKTIATKLKLLKKSSSSCH